MKVGTNLVVQNAELLTDTVHFSTHFLILILRQENGYFLNQDTKVDTF